MPQLLCSYVLCFTTLSPPTTLAHNILPDLIVDLLILFGKGHFIFGEGGDTIRGFMAAGSDIAADVDGREVNYCVPNTG